MNRGFAIVTADYAATNDDDVLYVAGDVTIDLSGVDMPGNCILVRVISGSASLCAASINGSGDSLTVGAGEARELQLIERRISPKGMTRLEWWTIQG